MPTTKLEQTTPTAANQWRGDTKDLPRAALQFRSECKFADASAATVPFTMTARTGDPIDHWFWGRVVHDMDGMQLSKPTLPVDYCHSPFAVIGYADKFDTSRGSLVVSGAVTPNPNDPKDRAAEIVRTQKLGVPYEASIDFSGGTPIVEYVREGASVTVNGKTFTGPGTVIRQWKLRGLAVCPHGADPDTTTEFKARAGDTVTVTTIKSADAARRHVDPTVQKLTQSIGPNLARFAAGMKLPNASKK